MRRTSAPTSADTYSVTNTYPHPNTDAYTNTHPNTDAYTSSTRASANHAPTCAWQNCLD